MKNTLLVFLLIFASACTTVHYNRREVLDRNNNITALNQRIEQAKAQEINLLAPGLFDQAMKKLEQAIKTARKSPNANEGNITAKQGLTLMARAENQANMAREVFKNALSQREQAILANAPMLYDDDFNKLDRRLRTGGTALESGKRKRALELNAELSQDYTELQVRSLKANLSQIAERAYNQAEDANAQRLAPQTFKSAKRELEIAKKIIEVEKENYEKARFHATRAAYLALRAKAIADQVTIFDKEDLSPEQIILWHQNQLDKIYSAYEEDLEFDKSHNQVVEDFRRRLVATLTQLASLESRTIGAERKVASIQEKLGAGDSNGSQVMEKVSQEALFQQISRLFQNSSQKDKVEVLKRNNGDIIIRAFGFSFPVGSAELRAKNYALLGKIVEAILKFPQGNFSIEGHTDKTGSDSLNMRLSVQRAQNIAEYLINVQGIDKRRITVAGYGSSRPIASNETAEGKSKNRRIEIVLNR